MKSFAFGPVAMLFFSAVAVIDFIAHVSAQGTQSSDQLAALRHEAEAAWNQRTNAIKSLTLKAEYAAFTKGRGNVPLEPQGPFSDGRPKEDRVLKTKLEYTYEHGKAAVTRSGPVIDWGDPERTLQQVFHATFDGALNASLIQQEKIVSGSIEKKGVANGYITQNAELLAVNLWLQPQVVLHDVGWSFKSMSVEENTVDVEGIRCRRLRVPRGTPNWTSAIDCDAEKGWIPVQWQTWLEGKLTMNLSIKYGDGKKTEPTVKEWVYSSYGKDGEIEHSRNAKVTKFEVNTDIDDNSFTIQFPIGARVSERVGDERRHYIQQSGGLKPLKESDSVSSEIK